MRIGVMIGGGNPAELINKAQDLEARGFHSLWMANFVGHGIETLSALTLIANETERISVGTAVIPIFLHHPVALAHQAISIQKVAQGRFSLGIGLSHPNIVEQWLGHSYQNPIAKMSEYLSILRPLLSGKRVSVNGDHFSAEAGVHLPEVERVPLLSAALGPRMLKLAGEMTDGTVTYLTGPHALETHIIPLIRGAAEEAGNPPPRIIAGGLPIALTDDVDSARAAVAERFAPYNALPSYRAMFEREGVRGPSEVAMLGDSSVLRASLDRLEKIGVTEFIATPAAIDAKTVERTLDFLAEQLV